MFFFLAWQELAFCGRSSVLARCKIKRAGLTGNVYNHGRWLLAHRRRIAAVDEEHTTIVVQRYLDELADGATTEPVVRALLERSVRRLEQLCAVMLHRSYPRLTQAPLNLQTDEMLSAVIERLLKALREARPKDVRQFFALASQHMRWELNDMARRLDNQPPLSQLDEELVSAPYRSDSGPHSQCASHPGSDREPAGG